MSAPFASRLTLLALLPLLGLLTACASRSPKLPGSELPTAEQLAQISSVVPASVVKPEAGRRVTQWALAAPLASAVGVGPARGASLGEQLLAQLSEQSGGGIVYDEALACAAHQLARFVAREGKVPIQPLASFMYHRCGVVATELEFGYASGPGTPTLAQAQELAASFGSHRGLAVGMWAEPMGDQQLLLAVAARSELSLDPVAMAAPGRQVVIKGQTPPREWLIAYVNQGKLGVEVCDTLSESGRAFTLTCPLDPLDPDTYIDILFAPPGRLFGEHAGRLWLSPDGSMRTDYLSPVSVANESPLPASLGASFVEMINVLRARGGLPALREVPAQSQQIVELMPHYEAARATSDRDLLDDIVLGLMAGWQVQEPVLDGNFSSLSLEAIRTRAELLETVLYQPYIRASVMQPGVERIAVGLAPPAGADRQRSAVFTTYRLAADPRAAAHALVVRIDKLRRSRSRPRLRALDHGTSALAAAAELVRGGSSPRQAMASAVADIAAHNPGKSIEGVVAFVQGIDKLETPQALLADGPLELAVHVELIESDDSPWASLLVLIAHVAG